MNQLFRRHRYPTAFPVIVSTNQGDIRCTVIDVNESGARLKGVKNVNRGERLTIQANNHRASGIVRWIADDRIGVTFQPQISMRTVDLIRQAVRTGRFRHRFSSASLTEMR